LVHGDLRKCESCGKIFPTISLKIVLVLLILCCLTVFFIIANYEPDSSSPHTEEKIKRPTTKLLLPNVMDKSSTTSSNDSKEYVCKLEAAELASRVMVNIRAGLSDYFYKVNLTSYKNKGCDKQLIMNAVKAMM
jgi:hypothetical protein